MTTGSDFVPFTVRRISTGTITRDVPRYSGAETTTSTKMSNETIPSTEQNDPAARYRSARTSHWDSVAQQLNRGKLRSGNAYHRFLARSYKFYVPPGQR